MSNRVHIIRRGDPHAQPDFVKMAQADFVFVIEPNGAAKCIKSRDGVYLDGNGNVTYEYIRSPRLIATPAVRTGAA